MQLLTNIVDFHKKFSDIVKPLMMEYARNSLLLMRAGSKSYHCHLADMEDIMYLEVYLFFALKENPCAPVVPDCIKKRFSCKKISIDKILERFECLNCEAQNNVVNTGEYEYESVSPVPFLRGSTLTDAVSGHIWQYACTGSTTWNDLLNPAGNENAYYANVLDHNAMIVSCPTGSVKFRRKILAITDCESDSFPYISNIINFNISTT
jgi:hypothetical protein